MKTSRLSADTAALIRAMSSRRTLRSATRAATAAAAAATPNAEKRPVAASSPVKAIKEEPESPAPSPRKRAARTAATTSAAPSTPSTPRAKRRRIVQQVEEVAGGIVADGTPTKVRAVTKARRTTTVTAKAVHQPPADWEELYNRVKRMREDNPTAPVDTVGCTELYVKTASPRDKRLHILIGLMLSAQTKDETTAAVMKRLHLELGDAPATASIKETTEADDYVEDTRAFTRTIDSSVVIPRTSTLTLDNLIAVPAVRLDELIRPVNYHNNKTKYIKATALMLRDDFGGDIPSTPETLMQLPGVGPKMAYLAMAIAWDNVVGIGVDVHVHRITNLWGWVKTKTPEETRLALQSWLPRDKWKEINPMLVGLGQTIKHPADLLKPAWWEEYERKRQLKLEEEGSALASPKQESQGEQAALVS
ncbi:DNA N-glycosylase and apurinic/apyrimidinic (AP) lyase [Ascosphaera acerosa]|nr:DNA N-glycosylase and apurinic/apyrimidinic (AP) lyase [Ascosphaera acerosa]